MSMFENDYRVERVPLKRGSDTKWIVSKNGSFLRGFGNKSDAKTYGRRVAKQDTPSSLVIEYQGGGIANKIEYT